MRTLKSVNSLVEGKGCSLFTAMFGSVFVLSGMWATGLFHDGLLVLPSLSFGILVYIGFGLMLMWGGLAQAKLFGQFGKPEAVVSSDTVAPGEKFSFSYKLPVVRETQIESIGIFLVLRERVSYYDGSETTTRDVDRLFQKYIQPERKYSVGETIEVRFTFRVPDGEMTLRNSYMGRKASKAERMWAVKVRVHMGRGKDLWGEYDLAITEGGSIASEAHPIALARFDVFLNGVGAMKMLAVTNVMSNLLPHLREGQVGDLYFARPSLLLEGVTREEAQQAKERLEAVGAEASVLATPQLRRQEE